MCDVYLQNFGWLKLQALSMQAKAVHEAVLLSSTNLRLQVHNVAR